MRLSGKEKLGLFRDDIIRDLAEHILLDKGTRKDVRERRRSCIKWRCSGPAGEHDKEELEKTRAAYRAKLTGIRKVWESSYLEAQRSTVVIRTRKEKRPSSF